MTSEWTEGVCGDGAAILRNGVMVPIDEVVSTLNKRERAIERIENAARQAVLAYFRSEEVAHMHPFMDTLRMALGMRIVARTPGDEWPEGYFDIVDGET